MAFPTVDESYSPMRHGRMTGVAKITAGGFSYVDWGHPLADLHSMADRAAPDGFEMVVLFEVPPKDHDKPSDQKDRVKQLAYRLQTETGLPSLVPGPRPFIRRGGRKPATNRKACETQLPGLDPVQHPSVSAAARALGVNQPTLLRWLSGEVPWPGGGEYRVRLDKAHLNGLRGRYVSAR